MPFETIDDIYNYLIDFSESYSPISVKELLHLSMTLLNLYSIKADSKRLSLIRQYINNIVDIIKENKINPVRDPFIKNDLDLLILTLGQYLTLNDDEQLVDFFKKLLLQIQSDDAIDQKLKILALSYLSKFSSDELKSVYLTQADELLTSLSDKNLISGLYFIYKVTSDKQYLKRLQDNVIRLNISENHIWSLCLFDPLFLPSVPQEAVSYIDKANESQTAWILSSIICALSAMTDNNKISSFISLISYILSEKQEVPEISMDIDKDKQSDIHEVAKTESLFPLPKEELTYEEEQKAIVKAPEIEVDSHTEIEVPPIEDTITEKITEEETEDSEIIELAVQVKYIQEFNYDESLVQSYLKRTMLYAFRNLISKDIMFYDFVFETITVNALFKKCYTKITELGFIFDRAIEHNKTSIYIFKKEDDMLGLSFASTGNKIIGVVLLISSNLKKYNLQDICG